MTIIQVEDSSLDLFDDVVVATTFQKINIGDLSVRYLNRTNKFDIPRTQRNELIFEHSGNDKVSTAYPYTAHSVKVIQNGIEVIQNGIIKITEADKDKYEIQILENLFDIFSSVKGKLIGTLQPIPASGWDASAIDTARLNTTNLISAAMWWGKSGNLYQVNYFLPCFFYHTLINKILQSTGLAISGSVLTSSDYLDLVIPYPNDSFAYPKAIADAYYDVGTGTGGIGGSQWALGFNDFFVTGTKSSPYGRWANEYYPASTLVGADSMSVTFSGSFVFSSIVWSAGTSNGRYWMTLMKNGVEVYSTDGLSNITYANTSGTITASTTQTVLPTDVFKWRIRATATGGTLTANSAVVNCSNSTALGTTTINRTSVSWNALWRDISCDDLLSDFFNRFGIIPKQVGGTLFLKTIQEILSDTSNAVDWSAKRVSNQNILSFDSGYAQNNLFEYQDSDYSKEAKLGTGEIDIAGSLTSTRTMFKSFFEKVQTVAFSLFNNVAYIPVYGTTSTGIDTFENKPTISILTLRSRVDETTITFNTIARSDYKLAHFVDGTKPKDTGFQYFLNQYYPLFSSAINKTKIIKRKYKLTEIDVSNFDPHLMIWDDGYFIVNKISNFVPSKQTEVELLKIF